MRFAQAQSFQIKYFLVSQMHQIYFSIRAMFHSLTFLMPNLPFSSGRHNPFQATLALLELISFPDQVNFQKNLNVRIIEDGRRKWEHQKVCIYSSTDLIRVSLPAYERKLLCQKVRQHNVLSSKTLQSLALSSLEIEGTPKVMNGERAYPRSHHIYQLPRLTIR